MLRITRRLALVGALATAIGLATGTATASAASTISGLPTKAPIINKLYVPVSITVSCQTPDPFPFPFSMASVTIRQVVARNRIAHGTATINTLTCDGAPHDHTLNVFPDTGGFPGLGDSPPFKTGNAVITAQLSTGFDSVAAGPQTIKLTR
jgi:hypothetical protein